MATVVAKKQFLKISYLKNPKILSQMVQKCSTGLNEVNSSVDLNEERRNTFHHIVAKLLYVSKRSRVDIDLAVSFLCTRVSKSDEED